MVAENVSKLVGATSRESFLVHVQSELIVTVGRSERSMVPDTLSCLDFQFSSPYRDTTVITTHSTTVFLLILCTYIVVVSRLFYGLPNQQRQNTEGITNSNNTSQKTRHIFLFLNNLKICGRMLITFGTDSYREVCRLCMRISTLFAFLFVSRMTNNCRSSRNVENR